MKIKQIKEIREQLRFSHIVIFGITEEGEQYIGTHGKTKANAESACRMGNEFKKHLEWPEELCKAEPLERICVNCEKLQREEHKPGIAIKDFFEGRCMNNPEPVKRNEKDIACQYFEPAY